MAVMRVAMTRFLTGRAHGCIPGENLFDPLQLFIKLLPESTSKILASGFVCYSSLDDRLNMILARGLRASLGASNNGIYICTAPVKFSVGLWEHKLNYKSPVL